MNAKATDSEGAGKKEVLAQPEQRKLTLFSGLIEEEKRIPIQVFCEPSLKEKLERLAENDGTNLSNFVRLALTEFLKTRRVADVLRQLEGRTRNRSSEQKKTKEKTNRKALKKAKTKAQDMLPL